MSELFLKYKVKHEKSAPYSPHQNGTAERYWRTLFDMARCFLIESGVQKYFWHYAVATANFIRNRCFNKRLSLTPIEALTGKRPNFGKLHAFGTVCYALAEDSKKLDPRSCKGIFLGYDKDSPAYFVYLPEKNVVRKVRCVNFNERFPNECKKQLNINDEFDVGTEKQISDNETKNTARENGKNVDEMEENVNNQENCNEGNIENIGNDAQNNLKRYPERTRCRPKYLEDYVSNINYEDLTPCIIDYVNCVGQGETPSTYNEAIDSSESALWNADIDCDIYVEQPKGYVQTGPTCM